jgi:hypothetical protein
MGFCKSRQDTCFFPAFALAFSIFVCILSLSTNNIFVPEGAMVNPGTIA